MDVVSLGCTQVKCFLLHMYVLISFFITIKRSMMNKKKPYFSYETKLIVFTAHTIFLLMIQVAILPTLYSNAQHFDLWNDIYYIIVVHCTIHEAYLRQWNIHPGPRPSHAQKNQPATFLCNYIQILYFYFKSVWTIEEGLN